MLLPSLLVAFSLVPVILLYLGFNFSSTGLSNQEVAEMNAKLKDDPVDLSTLLGLHPLWLQRELIGIRSEVAERVYQAKKSLDLKY